MLTLFQLKPNDRLISRQLILAKNVITEILTVGFPKTIPKVLVYLLLVKKLAKVVVMVANDVSI